MRWSPVGAFILCLTVALALSTGAVVAADGSTSVEDRSIWTDRDPVIDRFASSASIEFSEANQTIRIQLHSDGSAQISIIWSYPLENDVDRESFERLAGSFERNELDSELSLDVFERIIDERDRSTDRDHELVNVSRTSAIDDDHGRLNLSFQWTGFAETIDDELVVADSFRYQDETWLPSLSEDQRLEIHAPDGYAVVRSPTSVIDGMVAWDGPITFDPDEMELIYVASPGDQPPPPSNGDPPTNGLLAGWLTVVNVILALALAITLVLLGVVMFRRHDGSLLDGIDIRTPGAGDTDELTPHEPADDVTDGGDTATESLSEEDIELLSDEERVIRLLRANDGRMKQATIVKETQWSNAKVSQLLSSMDEEGVIEKLRIGRENLITLLDGDGADTG